MLFMWPSNSFYKLDSDSGILPTRTTSKEILGNKFQEFYFLSSKVCLVRHELQFIKTSQQT